MSILMLSSVKVEHTNIIVSMLMYGGCMDLGERIKEIRKECSITQNDFARRMLVSASYISKVESGKETPSDIFLKLMSLEFGISLDWIKTGKGSKKITKDSDDYFERSSDYSEDIDKNFNILKEALTLLPNSINSSVSWTIDKYTHILKLDGLTDAQKVLIASVISDIMVDIDELVVRASIIDKNDYKELFNYERSYMNLRTALTSEIDKLKETIIYKQESEPIK